MLTRERLLSFWDWMSALTSGVWRLLDEGMLVRRVGLVWAAWLQCEALTWSYSFANEMNGIDGLGKAAIIAAVLGPASALFAAMVKFYGEGRGYVGPINK